MYVERIPMLFYCQAQFGALFMKHIMGKVVGDPRALFTITPPGSPARAAIRGQSALNST
jgi:hypothetical protein